MKYKINFNDINWESPFNGIKHKYLDQENIRIRLVEYSKMMPPHWCEKAHYGYVLDGIMDIEYDKEVIRYMKGDGIFIPAGKEHQHKAVAITENVKVFFIEILE